MWQVKHSSVTIAVRMRTNRVHLVDGAETGLLWMWAELWCFLSSGDRYVGELLELQQGCEGPFGSSRGECPEDMQGAWGQEDPMPV